MIDLPVLLRVSLRYHLLDYGKGQLGGAIFGAAAGSFEGIAELLRVLNFGDSGCSMTDNAARIL
jgi:hypothetical protein